jgi:hypothetical protein
LCQFSFFSCRSPMVQHHDHPCPNDATYQDEKRRRGSCFWEETP